MTAESQMRKEAEIYHARAKAQIEVEKEMRNKAGILIKQNKAKQMLL